jgi:hypothetical protein
MKMAHAGYVRGALLRLGSGHTVSVVYLVVCEQNYPQGDNLSVSTKLLNEFVERLMKMEAAILADMNWTIRVQDRIVKAP